MTSPKLTVFVAGGLSNTGSATISHLLKSHPNVTIRAGVRSASKAAQKYGSADAKRLTFNEYDIKPDTKSSAIDLKGVDALLLVAPQAFQDRTGVAAAYIAAAKAAGVKHVVFISAPVAKTPNLILGKGMFESEKLIAASGIPATLLHLLFFFENHFGNTATIKSQGAWYYPAKSDVPVGALSVSDIGEAAANVLVGGPSKHGNKTYTLAGEQQSWDAVAAVYTKVLGKPVKFVSVPDEAAIKAMTGAGYPDLMAKGMVELHHEFDKAPVYPNDQLTALLGHAPQTFEQWLTINAAAFK